MSTSGTTIDRIVRGWRSRWPSEICETSVGSLLERFDERSGS